VLGSSMVEELFENMELLHSAVEGLVPVPERLPKEHQLRLFHESRAARCHNRTGIIPTVAVISVRSLACLH